MDKRTLIYLFFLAISFYLVQLFFPSKPANTTSSNAASNSNSRQSTQMQESQDIANNTQNNQALPSFSSETQNTSVSDSLVGKNATNETYYVLENEHEQLVFSDIGGALVEINLPFKSEKNPKSMVRSIAFDKNLLSDSKENCYFPLKSYYTSGMEKHEQGQLGGYYPLLRRSIVNPQGSFTIKVDPAYYSLNILKGNDESFARQRYKVKRFEKNLIEFVLDAKGTKITKTYTFAENTNANIDKGSSNKESKAIPYMVDLKISLSSNQTDFYLSSGVPEVEMVSNAFTPYLKYRALFDDKEKVKKFSLPKTGTESFSENHPVDWISNENGFFGLIINPIKTSPLFGARYIAGNNIPTRLTLIDAQYNTYPAKSYPGYQMLIALPASKEINLRFFSGPYQDSLLKAIDQEYVDTVGKNPSYTSVKKPFGFFTFVSDPFAQLLLIVMRLFYFLTHSWGFSIILLTIAFRIMLYPLNAWSIKSTARMNEVAPMVKIIQAKYKNDPKKAQMEIMQLYKSKKANPASGCLPVLIQMPFLIGMFDLLKSTFDLRGVPFIPGWINSLTAPDVLFSWDYPIYFIGTEFHLLPILLGIVMLVQSKMNVKVPKGGVMTDQQKQTKSMSWIMSVLMTFLFYKAASGLNIYFLFSMFLGVVQQWLMGKKKAKE